MAPATVDFDDRLERALKALPAPSGGALEVTLLETESRTIGWADGKPNLNNAAVAGGACVRALVDGAQGLATSTAMDPQTVAGLAERALTAAAASAKDPHRRFAPAGGVAPAAVPSDRRIFRRPADEILDELSGIEKAVLKRDPRLTKIVRLQISERRQSRAIGNTLGLGRTDVSTSAAFSVELLAVDGAVTEAAWDFQGNRFSDRLRPAEVSAALAEHALRSLGGKPLATGRYPVVLAPRVGAQLLDLVAQALSAEAVQKGQSFLKGLVGKRVASDKVTLKDDPFLEDGVASEAFDDEGVAHAQMTAVDAGILRDYFHDLRSSARDHRASNGHASKSGLGAPPHPAATNLFVASGDTSADAMLSSGKKVFLLREVMGLHMADPITGEFSLGGSGYLFENGRFAAPVRGVTIAGSVGGMLANVTAVGTDLTWYGALGCPSLLVEGLTVAGA